MKEYGQLRLIGVTNKQIRYITNHKFLKLLIVGTPLGGIAGELSDIWRFQKYFRCSHS